MQIPRNAFACKFQRTLQMGQRVIRFWWESGLSSASRNHLTTFCGPFVHYACLRLCSAIVHFIQNNCLYSVWYGCSAETSPIRWFGKHEYDVKLWHHKQRTPNINDTIRHWMKSPLWTFSAYATGVCHPSRTPSDRLLYDETFAQPCIFAVVNCPGRSTERVLLPCFNALPDIFAVMNCSVLEDRYNLCSLQWYIVAYHNE